MYSFTPFMTMALEGGEASAPRPGCSLPPGKMRYPLYRRLGGPQGRSGQVRKISPPTGIRSPDPPARSQSLYWLRYLAHLAISGRIIFSRHLMGTRLGTYSEQGRIGCTFMSGVGASDCCSRQTPHHELVICIACISNGFEASICDSRIECPDIC